jgi:hypothetical protein
MSATAPTTLPVLALSKRYAEEFTRRVLAEVDEVGNCVGLVAGKWHVSIPADVELDRFYDPLERLKPGEADDKSRLALAATDDLRLQVSERWSELEGDRRS